MSRRKQANPRSFKLTDDAKLSQKDALSNNFVEQVKPELPPQMASEDEKQNEIKIKLERFGCLSFSLKIY